MPINNFRTPDGDIENESFITEEWLVDQWIGDQLWSWGNNNVGQLGINDSITRSRPVTVSGTNWKQVSTANEASAAIKTDGTLWVWGNNSLSALGINATGFKLTPVTTFAGGTNWKQVSISDHTAAIKTDGSLWMWGYNVNGKVGNNTIGFTQTSTPVTTFAGGNDWRRVSVGSQHTAAIKTDGSLWVWGQNLYSQLGKSPNTQSNTPITTFAGGNDWKQVSAGGQNTAAIKTDGTLWLWGRNSSGQLGTNDTIASSTPITTFTGGNDWKQVACGDHNSVGNGFIAAIKTDGTLWTWGSNIAGELGTNDTVNRSTPVTTFAGGNNWKFVSCGTNSVSAIKTDGSLWVWGRNTNAQLGNDDVFNPNTPITTFAGGTNWKQCSIDSSVLAVTSGPDY
jgi:alpha-tubulin suppressor-like RCC1 family protein